jgi:hypothetical protein
MLLLDTDRSSAELIAVVLGDEGYGVRTILDSRPARAAGIAHLPCS